MNIKKTIKVMSYELDCVKRQVGPGCDRNCRDCDLALSDDLVIDAFETVMDILRAQQEAEKSELLTQEQLLGMNGMPVYDSTFKRWCLIKKMEPSYLGGIEPVYNDGSIRPDPLCGRGYYRRPPKEAE